MMDLIKATYDPFSELGWAPTDTSGVTWLHCGLLATGLPLQLFAVIWSWLEMGFFCWFPEFISSFQQKKHPLGKVNLLNNWLLYSLNSHCVCLRTIIKNNFKSNYVMPWLTAAMIYDCNSVSITVICWGLPVSFLTRNLMVSR